MLGEEAFVRFSTAAEYPGSFSPAQGASIWIPYLTAWGALIHNARVRSGDFVVIPAAFSSAGLAAMEITRDAGAVAIAATRTAEKRAELVTLGADHVVATDEEDLPARVREVSGGKGARVIFDSVSDPYVEELAAAAASRATIFLYGGLSAQPTAYPLAMGLAKGSACGDIRRTKCEASRPYLKMACGIFPNGCRTADTVRRSQGPSPRASSRRLPFPEIQHAVRQGGHRRSRVVGSISSWA